MRPVLGVVSLLMVLAVVGVIARKQLREAVGSREGTASGAATEWNAQQTQREIKAAIEGVMLQPRPMPDDKWCVTELTGVWWKNTGSCRTTFHIHGPIPANGHASSWS